MPIQTAIDSISNSQGSPFGFKNRIINGAMVIDQRYAGAAGSVAINTAPYSVDRWMVFGNVAAKFTYQQNAGSVTPPTGFTNYLGITSSSAYTVGAGETFGIFQSIEGFNTADLQWGTASAATVTLSFWVRSSLTGTFGGVIQNSVFNRAYPYTYTINSANTWEYKTVTIPGDTSGTWIGATNGTGLRIQFSVGTGSTVSTTAGAWAAGNFNSAPGAVSVVATNGATFYITGVQLEKGSTATSFDYRPYGTEEALCQRYFQLMDMGYVYSYAPSGNQITSNYTYPVAMRTASTVAIVTNPTFGSGTAVTSYQTTARMTAFFMTTNGAGFATWTGGQFSASAEL
jgi:hypothetical protein